MKFIQTTLMEYRDWSRWDQYDGNSTWTKWPRFVASWCRYYVPVLVCRFKGHKWVDDGYAGPDSGCIDMSCQRCGESYFTNLY